MGNLKEWVPILGIEGGGTKTSWIFVGEEGRTLAEGTAGPSNVLLVGRAGLEKVFRQIAAALPGKPVAIGGGFAGARGQPEFAVVRAALRSVWPRAERVVVGQDTDVGLAAAWGGEDGLLVIAGTGSNVVGRKGSVRLSAGGHGHLLGDAGSGYDIVQRALEAVFRARDREGKAVPLVAALLAHAGAADLDRLLRAVYGAQGKEWLAAFAPVILRAAEKGDVIARQAVREGVGELAERIAELAKRMKIARPRIARTGGLFENSFYVGTFVRALRKACPQARSERCKTSGVVGAVRMVGGFVRASAGQREEKSVVGLVDVEALPTERTNPRSRGMHRQSVGQLVRLFVEEEAFTVRALSRAKKEIKGATEIVSRALTRGGRLFYVGAGTSGRLGVLDASEMPPTFQTPPELVQAILAGGPEAIFRAQEGAEDDGEAGARSVRERRVGSRDVLVGLTASGRTPFVHGALAEGKKAGAKTILVTAHPTWKAEKKGIRPDGVVRLDVGPEIIAGSTRLKAGTVTKMVCNILSSVAMIRMGKVYDNLMVHVVPSNKKLKARAIRLIRTLTGVGEEEAERALRESGGKVMLATERLRKVSSLPKKRRGALLVR